MNLKIGQLQKVMISYMIKKELRIMNSNPHYGIQCPKCREILFSESTDDHKFCNCKSVSIDGGTDYLRYSWSNDITKQDVILVVRGEENITSGNGA